MFAELKYQPEQPVTSKIIDWTSFWVDKNKRELNLKGYSRRTVDGYSRSLEPFLKNFKKHPGKITEDEVKNYLSFIDRQRDLEESTYNNIIAALRFFFKEVLKTGVVDIQIPRKKIKKKLPVVLSQEELKQIFVVTTNIKHRLLLKTGYAFGLRVSSALKLKLENFDISRGILNVVNDKGKKDRQVPLSENYLKELKEYLEVVGETRYLFPGQFAGTHLSSRSADLIMKRALERIGCTKNASFHTLRHSYATHLHERGTSIRTIQELLGHSSIKTTEIYTKVSKAEIAKVKSPLDDL